MADVGIQDEAKTKDISTEDTHNADNRQSKMDGTKTKN
jgi:hypothetical protein